jgi:hypothetical protein
MRVSVCVVVVVVLLLVSRVFRGDSGSAGGTIGGE